MKTNVVLASLVLFGMFFAACISSGEPMADSLPGHTYSCESGGMCTFSLEGTNVVAKEADGEWLSLKKEDLERELSLFG